MTAKVASRCIAVFALDLPSTSEHRDTSNGPNLMQCRPCAGTRIAIGKRGRDPVKLLRYCVRYIEKSPSMRCDTSRAREQHGSEGCCQEWRNRTTDERASLVLMIESTQYNIQTIVAHLISTWHLCYTARLTYHSTIEHSRVHCLHIHLLRVRIAYVASRAVERDTHVRLC